MGLEESKRYFDIRIKLQCKIVQKHWTFNRQKGPLYQCEFSQIGGDSYMKRVPCVECTESAFAQTCAMQSLQAQPSPFPLELESLSFF